MRPIELIASYWTIAGPIYSTGPTEISPWGFRERVEAAAKAGFRGVGFLGLDLEAQAALLGYPTMRKILDDNGIKHFEVEIIGDWYADGERKAASDRAWSVMLEAAEELDAVYIKAYGDPGGGDWSDSRMIERFKALCRDAENAGTKVAIEIMPFTNIRTLERGLKIVEGAGAPNGGLCVDVWHTSRQGISPAEIAKVPKKWFLAAEIDDAKARPIGPLLEDTIHRRELCGEGDLDIRGFVAACEAAGFDGMYGVEILSSDQRQRPLGEAARRAFETAIVQFDFLKDDAR